jgi:hypothetical protein
MIRRLRELFSLTPNGKAIAFLTAEKPAEAHIAPSSDDRQDLIDGLTALGARNIKTMSRLEGNVTGYYASFEKRHRLHQYGVKATGAGSWGAILELAEHDLS